MVKREKKMKNDKIYMYLDNMYLYVKYV
jgi:hypothetical protein